MDNALDDEAVGRGEIRGISAQVLQRFYHMAAGHEVIMLACVGALHAEVRVLCKGGGLGAVALAVLYTFQERLVRRITRTHASGRAFFDARLKRAP